MFPAQNGHRRPPSREGRRFCFLERLGIGNGLSQSRANCQTCGTGKAFDTPVFLCITTASPAKVTLAETKWRGFRYEVRVFPPTDSDLQVVPPDTSQPLSGLKQDRSEIDSATRNLGETPKRAVELVPIGAPPRKSARPEKTGNVRKKLPVTCFTSTRREITLENQVLPGETPFGENHRVRIPYAFKRSFALCFPGLFWSADRSLVAKRRRRVLLSRLPTAEAPAPAPEAPVPAAATPAPAPATPDANAPAEAAPVPATPAATVSC